MGIVFRIILALAGIIAGLFVARDADNFTFLQTMAALFLIVLMVIGAALWPSLSRLFRSRRQP